VDRLINARRVHLVQHQMATPQRQEAVHKEGRLILAVQAYQTSQIQSLTTAAKTFDVARNTLQRRASGIQPQLGAIAKNRLLTPTEEESLVQWILSMDRRGMPPKLQAVRQMAALLLTQYQRPVKVGLNWAGTFVKRHEALKSKYNRKYDYQRAKCEDPELIRAWFRRVEATVIEYGILDDDYYNFDETGFQMGVIMTSKVVTGTDRAGRPRTTQPGNREWVTSIEAINARGFAIPPLIIFKAVMHQASWYQHIPHDWAIGVSENGWTNNEIGLY
jgi:hypothetical protein